MLKSLLKFHELISNLLSKKNTVDQEVSQLKNIVNMKKEDLSDALINDLDSVDEIREELTNLENKLEKLEQHQRDLLYSYKNVKKSKAMIKQKELVFKEYQDTLIEKSVQLTELRDKKYKIFDQLIEIDTVIDYIRYEVRMLVDDWEEIRTKKDKYLHPCPVNMETFDNYKYQKSLNGRTKEENEKIKRIMDNLNQENEAISIIMKDRAKQQQRYVGQIVKEAKEACRKHDELQKQAFEEIGRTDEKFGTVKKQDE